jgi:aromatic-L-amino-acid/L-tryptophan decarboxylase
VSGDKEGSDPRFDWHPEPELLDYRDATSARPALRQLGDDAWTAALDWLYGEAMRRPVGSDGYLETRRRFFGPSRRPATAPPAPTPSRALLDEVRERLSPYQFNAQHPRTFSYFTPPPLPISIVGELLAQWWQQGVDVWHAGPTSALVEEEVITWLRDLLGFDDAAWGVLTSGGVMANLMALTLAREIHLPILRGDGGPARGGQLENTRIYASDQSHFSIARSLAMLGFPDDSLRIIPSDDRFRLRGDMVAEAIAKDRAAGYTPLAISAVAGSTNTGSVDRVDELADVASREEVWLHVDAAYGGAARFSTRDAPRVPALERADTVTVDPHKWFFQSYDIGGLIVRRREDLLHTFQKSPEYYRSSQSHDEPLNWYQYSLEGTRRFRALKLWLSWKHLGTEGFARLVEGTNDLAAYLARRCHDLGEFETLPETPELSVVCFRHVPVDVDPSTVHPEALDAYENGLQRALEVSGEAWVSTTILRDRVYLRAGVMNYYSTRQDVDRMLEKIRELSPGVIKELGIA